MEAGLTGPALRAIFCIYMCQWCTKCFVVFKPFWTEKREKVLVSPCAMLVQRAFAAEQSTASPVRLV